MSITMYDGPTLRPHIYTTSNKTDTYITPAETNKEHLRNARPRLPLPPRLLPPPHIPSMVAGLRQRLAREHLPYRLLLHLRALPVLESRHGDDNVLYSAAPSRS